MKMAVEEKEKKTNAQSVEQKPEETADFKSELRERVWSVISFEKLEAANLTYTEAEQKLAELEAQKFSGLCIVTDEVAARIAAKDEA
jgi:hypothetical protein